MKYLLTLCILACAPSAVADGPTYLCNFEWATTGNGGCESGVWGRFIDGAGNQFAVLQPEGSPYGCSIFCQQSYCFSKAVGCLSLQSNCYAVSSSSGGIQVFASATCRRFSGRFFAPPSASAPAGELLFIFRNTNTNAEIAPQTVACYPGSLQFVEVSIDVPAGFNYLQVAGLHWLADDLVLEAQTPPPPCLADLFVDGVVNGADLGIALAQWGQGAGAVADINDDGVVNGADLSIILSTWGACP